VSIRASNLRIVLAASFAAVSVGGCYTGIEGEYFGYATGGSFGEDETDEGSEFGTTGEDSAGDGDPTTGDGDPSTGDGDPSTGDGDPSTGDGDPSTGDGDPTTGDGDPTTGDGDGDPTTGDGDPSGDMPNNSYCTPAHNWPSAWNTWELEVIELVNQARASGGNCGTQGNFPPSGPLTWNSPLTCAARIHSKDMADNNYFNHTNLDGNGPGWRMQQAGYSGGYWGENIGAGYGSPAQAVQGWLNSDGHCANLHNASFTQIGVGYAYGSSSTYGHYWTQKFGN
jgi:uncharacterized protein YkwD